MRGVSISGVKKWYYPKWNDYDLPCVKSASPVSKLSCMCWCGVARAASQFFLHNKKCREERVAASRRLLAAS